MTLTPSQQAMLSKIAHGTFNPYGLQVGSCRALGRRGLAYEVSPGLWKITDAGRVELERKRKAGTA